MNLPRHRAGLLAAIAAAGLLAISATGASAACHRFGDIVTLAGHFAPDVIAENGNLDPYGIPGRTSDLLVLDGVMCMLADPISDKVAGVADVQLRCPDVALQKGEHTTLRGRLFGAHTGNGHTPVLLVCRDD